MNPIRDAPKALAFDFYERSSFDRPQAVCSRQGRRGYQHVQWCKNVLQSLFLSRSINNAFRTKGGNVKVTAKTAHEIATTSSLTSAIVAYGHLPTSKEDASATGYDMYFTRKPCGNGHFSPRYTKNKACMRCAKENVERSRKGDKESEEERFMQELRAIPSDRSDEALAALLIHAGGQGVVPGVVFFDCRSRVPALDAYWLSAMEETQAWGGVIPCNDGTGFFFPRIMQTNFPRTLSQTTAWRKMIEGFMESELKRVAIEFINETLRQIMDEPGFTIHKRNVIAAWVGVGAASKVRATRSTERASR